MEFPKEQSKDQSKEQSKEQSPSPVKEFNPEPVADTEQTDETKQEESQKFSEMKVCDGHKDEHNLDDCPQEATDKSSVNDDQRAAVMTITKCPHTHRKHYAKNMCSSCYRKFGRN